MSWGTAPTRLRATRAGFPAGSLMLLAFAPLALHRLWLALGAGALLLARPPKPRRLS
jgi:hypothetical protein